MKKTFYLIFTFCAVFLSVILFLEDADSIYTAVFKDKTCIVIEKQEGQTNAEFAGDLAASGRAVGAELLFVTVENASARKPTFHVYTTAVSEAFLDVGSNYPGAEIPAGQYLTTETNDPATAYRIFGSTLYNHFRVFGWEDVAKLDMNHRKFYTQTGSVKRLAAALTGSGYQVSMVADDARLEGSAAMRELEVMFLLLTVFLFFSILCRAFSVRREIVIKKANGYGEAAVFASTFLGELLMMPVILLGVFFLSGVLEEALYPHTFWSYIRAGGSKVAAYLAVSVGLYLAACVYVQFMKSANEIRGSKPSRMLYFLALFLRLIVSAVVIWGLTCSQQAVLYERDLRKTQEQIGPAAQEYAVLSLNSGSSDLYGNMEEYTRKSMALIHALSEEFGAVVVDSGEYVDMDGQYERILYVNQAFFTLQPVYDAQGRIIDVGSGGDVVTILLPDNYSGDIVSQVQQHQMAAEIIRYAAGQRFLTYNQYSAIEDHGTVCDPVIMVLNDSELYWHAQRIIGMQFMLIPCGDADPYEALKGTIERCGMSGVVLEAQRLGVIFDTAVMNARIKVFQYSAVSALYIAVGLLVTVFETTVYYENNKRMLTIRKLHGYGRRAYTGMFAGKAAVLAVLAVLSVPQRSLVFAALAALTDAAVSWCCIRKLERSSIVMYLKGDM